MNCLVTGGAGFIGSHLVEGLVAAGHNVRVLDDFSSGKRENLKSVADKIDVRSGSVADSTAVEDAMRDRQWVFHLAALPSVQKSIEDPLLSHALCATATLQVLEASRKAGVKRLVFAASSSAYGDTPGAIRTEDDPLVPLSPYAAAKLASEHYCRVFTIAFGLETVRLRFFNIFGPRQDAKSPYSGVIALFIRSWLTGQTPTIFGDGSTSRDFVYVTDAVQAMMKAAAAPGATAAGKVYNVGCGGAITLLELAQHLNQILGKNVTPHHGPERVGDVRYSQADISRARRDLGYEPEIAFAEGLRRTVAAQL